MAAGRRSSHKTHWDLDTKDGSASSRITDSLITCDVCGKKYPKVEMRQCAKCGMIVCPGCWPQHRCEMDHFPLVGAERKAEIKAKISQNSRKAVDTVVPFVQGHKRQILIAAGVLLLVIIVAIVVANIGGPDPVEGEWTVTVDGAPMTLNLNGDGTGVLFTTEAGIEIAHDILWKKVSSAEYPYSIALGSQWYPQGNSKLSADNTLLTIGTNNTATYLQDVVITFSKKK